MVYCQRSTKSLSARKSLVLRYGMWKPSNGSGGRGRCRRVALVRDAVERRREIEEFLHALGIAVELVVTVGIVVAELQLLTEVREGVDGVGDVGAAVGADVLEHGSPRRTLAL